MAKLALSTALAIGVLPVAALAKDKPPVDKNPAIEHIHKNQDQPAQELAPDPEPHMIPMTQDGNPPLKKPDIGRNLDMAQTATDMGAQYGRVVVYPRDILRTHPKWQVYDNQIWAYKMMGKQVYMSLSGRGVGMDENRYVQFATAVAEHTKEASEDIDWFGIMNEPNSPEEMQKLKGLSEPQSYRVYYVMAREAIRKVLPYARTDIGELNGWPMSGGIPAEEFFREMVVCPDNEPNCPPLEAEGYAHHPYGFTINPRSSSSSRSEVVSVNNAVVIHKMLDWAFKKGYLRYTGSATGDGMPIDYTEFTYLVRAPEVKQNPDLNQDSPRYLLDRTRKVWFRTALNKMCTDPRIRLINIYQPLPPPDKWPGPFHGQIKYKNGKKYPSYYVIKKIFEQRPDCVKSPEFSATGGVSSLKMSISG